tara:strand:+ start:288 stop:482 length:195 start_codon:yes stop_codon:yes gene_type:complete
VNIFCDYQAKREALNKKSWRKCKSAKRKRRGTGYVDHLAMISSNIKRTIVFYNEILGMTVNRIV